MSIQLYDIEEYQEEYLAASMEESPDGDYVLYTDHAAEVERLTAENKKYVDDLVNRGTTMINVLTAERDAAVARAERAEEALIDLLDGESVHDIRGNTGLSESRCAEIVEIRNAALSAAANFRSGNSIRIPCEEIVAVARS